MSNNIAISGQGPLTVLPKTVVDALNNQVHFHCASISASYAIYWEVDGTEARTVQVQARGITFMTTTGAGTVSVLTMEASITNNNTEVVCIALNVEDGEIVQRSPTAYLIIQGKPFSIINTVMKINHDITCNVDTGLLAAPSNLAIISSNLTAIDLRWTPPFSLNITNTDEDMLFYSIKITNHDTGEVSFDNSSYPGYTLLSMKSFHCDTFGFQVTGWNSVGEGNISDTVNASFEKRKNVMIMNTASLHSLLYFTKFLALMLNSPSVANITVNNTVEFHCEYACISNTIAVWFIEDKIDMDVNLDQISVRRSSNRDEACGNPAAAHISTLHYNEILEISPLVSFDHPIPVYCAYILACNNRMECSPQICFSDLVGELQGMDILFGCIVFL